MKCKKCNTNLPPTANYCFGCGSKTDKNPTVTVPCMVSDIVYVDKTQIPHNYLKKHEITDFIKCEVISIIINKKGVYVKLRALYPSRIGKVDYLMFSALAFKKGIIKYGN